MAFLESIDAEAEVLLVRLLQLFSACDVEKFIGCQWFLIWIILDCGLSSYNYGFVSAIDHNYQLQVSMFNPCNLKSSDMDLWQNIGGR
jgi:hypothetical protein